ncbi:MAG: hydrogenase maturation nickel metallochaperone HypA [Oscillospiraceae bacterium]|nr:hydrogenase maturation nickel metallochaperone HypA [Oscillospiraceae bacterium]
MGQGTCKNCKKTYNYDAKDGFCPKCGSYNRPAAPTGNSAAREVQDRFPGKKEEPKREKQWSGPTNVYAVPTATAQHDPGQNTTPPPIAPGTSPAKSSGAKWGIGICIGLIVLGVVVRALVGIFSAYPGYGSYDAYGAGGYPFANDDYSYNYFDNYDSDYAYDTYLDYASIDYSTYVVAAVGESVPIGSATLTVSGCEWVDLSVHPELAEPGYRCLAVRYTAQGEPDGDWLLDDPYFLSYSDDPSYIDQTFIWEEDDLDPFRALGFSAIDSWDLFDSLPFEGQFLFYLSDDAPDYLYLCGDVFQWNTMAEQYKSGGGFFYYLRLPSGPSSL